MLKCVLMVVGFGKVLKWFVKMKLVVVLVAVVEVVLVWKVKWFLVAK